MNRAVCPVAFAFIALAGCSDPKSARDHSNPDDTRPAWFTLCHPESSPCDERLAIANRNGVKVGVWPQNKRWDLDPIRERPDLPRPDELAEPVPMLSADAGNCCHARNSYPLSRLQIGVGAAPFLTTANDWPVLACEITVRDWMSCSVGIEVHGRFIEIHFSPETKRVPTQRELWDLASATDEQVRSSLPHSDEV